MINAWLREVVVFLESSGNEEARVREMSPWRESEWYAP